MITIQTIYSYNTAKETQQNDTQNLMIIKIKLGHRRSECMS